MPLHSFRYAEKQETAEAWRTDLLTFGKVNLLVGKNATGKTRIIDSLCRAAELLATGGPIPPETAEWELEITNGEALRYELASANGVIQRERFVRGSTALLMRDETGRGRLYAEGLRQEMEFHSPRHVVAAVARRDLLQHRFLEPLHEWAASVEVFRFGAPTARTVEASGGGEILVRYQRGLLEEGDSFAKRVIEDMQALGYPLEEIRLTHATHLGEPLLLVKEERLRAPTPLTSLSQGMLRSLALVLFMCRLRKAGAESPCVLVDDLGEGLDFRHSCQVVEWLLKRAEEMNFQLIFSTNDRFIMNKVPLEHWTILDQEGELTRVINYHNSRERFDDFKFTGLCNFDFFSMDFAGDDNGD